jgi:hypothetical protein
MCVTAAIVANAPGIAAAFTGAAAVKVALGKRAQASRPAQRDGDGEDAGQPRLAVAPVPVRKERRLPGLGGDDRRE